MTNVRRSILLLLAACGPAPGYGSGGATTSAGSSGGNASAGPVTQVNVTNVTNNVYVAWGDSGPEEGIDWNDPRLQRAVRETAQLIGHPVELHFNVAMMPRPTRWFFDNLFETQVGHIPRDIERFKGEEPQAFAEGAARLRQIFFDYDGSVREPSIEFHSDRGVLWIRLGSGWIPERAVSYGFREAYIAFLDRRFDGRRAEDVESAAYADYFRWIDELGNRGDRDRRSAALRNATVLWHHTQHGPVDLHAEITAWLVDEASFFRNDYNHHADELASLGQGSPWREAEREYCRFINAAWPRLSDEHRLDLLEEMYLRRSGPGRERDPYLRDVYPGVDLFALSLGVVDRWIRAGHPAPDSVSDRDHTGRLYLYVVCAPRPEGDHMFDRGRCDSDFYRHASTDAQLQTRLFDEVLRRGDAELTTALFANLRWIGSPHVMAAWRRFERDPAQWGAATRVIAELVGYDRDGDRATLYDDAVRLWRANPALRGSILYLLAAIDEPRHSSVVQWDEFARIFGSLASRRDFEAYLSYGDGAIRRVASVWPALAPNADGADALVPALERAMNDNDRLRSDIQRVAHGVLRSLMETLRERRDTASMARLRRYFEDRKRRHPSEEAIMDTFIGMTTR
jgi:hypothetical protein